MVIERVAIVVGSSPRPARATAQYARNSWAACSRRRQPPARVDERTYAAAIAEQITTRQRWRGQYEAAKAHTAARAGPAQPGDGDPGSAVRQASEGGVK
jgi:hypothetical protein